MSTAVSTRGMIPVKLLGGQPYNGAVTHYPITSTYDVSIFKGDIVEIAPTDVSTTLDSGDISRMTHDAAMPNMLGVFMGCAYTDATMGFIHRQYWPAGQIATDAVAYICDDPDVIYEVQSDGIVLRTDVGENFEMVEALAGQTSTGNSRVQLANGTAGTAATLPLNLIGFPDRVGSTVGDAYTDCLVRLVTHRHRTLAGIA